VTGRNLLALSFRVIGLSLAAIAIVTAVYSILFVANSYVTKGRIEGYSTIQNSISVMPDSDQTGILYYPVVTYVDANGVERQFTGPQGRARPVYETGDEVDVRVSESSSPDARMASLMGVRGSTVVLGAVALLFLLLGFVAPYGFGGLRRPY